MQNLTYAGDIPPTETWQRLTEDSQAVLIDVRTPEEWAYVGLVNLDALHRNIFYVPWLLYPHMIANTAFVDQVKDAVNPKKDTPLLFLCRSGVRSAHAANTFTGLGFTQCYNVAGGFEGDLDDDHHRARQNGWKAAGLPWTQT